MLTERMLGYTPQEIDHTLAAGMNEHLGKPMSMAQLHATLRKYSKPLPDRLRHEPPSPVTADRIDSAETNR